jgi:ATP-dependent Lhr-like helicase
VFNTTNYFLVKDENRTSGTVDAAYPVGIRFALAGLTWEVVDLNIKSAVIFVKKVPGIAMVEWNVDFDADLHTYLIRKMRDILSSDEDFPYMSDRCRERLREIRYIAENTGITRLLVTELSEKKYGIFPWAGTRQLMTLHLILSHHGIKNSLPWITSIYLEAKWDGTADELETEIYRILRSDINLYELNISNNARIDLNAKYNEFVPPELLHKQFVEDYLDLHGLRECLLDDTIKENHTMPFYDLRCPKCQKEYNIAASMADKTERRIPCPDCGSFELETVYKSAPAFIKSRGDAAAVCPHSSICGGCGGH